MSTESISKSVLDVIRSTWGFEELRPLQLLAMQAELDHRDSLVVMPTGGGKSLCYQVPPLIAGRTDVVVSPLISLMKDQVDGLRELGYPAAAVNSGLDADEKRRVDRDLAERKLRLIFASPERLCNPGFVRQLQATGVQSFAIDEAHCISHWGHDFRPEYRQLAELRRHFPNAALHAYTATATERVRKDIIHQLQLKSPTVLIGNFDRPNLTYRVIPRVDVYAQTAKIILRHSGEAVIVYCISRKDTEAMAGFLKEAGLRAEHYHAGMGAEERRRTQEAFIDESLDVIVATVAFGMGIDRSNVRCVIHAGLPKSVEHYQQESGRAGRDGLPAECVLLYSHADAEKWKSLMARNAQESGQTTENLEAQFELLEHLRRYASIPVCRHQTLLQYFGQSLEKGNCGACDVCLGEIDGMPDSTVVAQKILSCVAKVGERFGVGHVADVLLGANTERIRACRHDQLSTFALMKEFDKKSLTNLSHQLVDLGLLDRTADEYPVLRLNPESWRVLRGERTVVLQQPARKAVKTSREDISWEGVDQGLFDSLRALRRLIAEERAVPPYVIFNDATLRDLAQIRPSSPDVMKGCFGVGEKKLADLGERFLVHIRKYCEAHRVSLNNGRISPITEVPLPRRPPAATHTTKAQAYTMFRNGQSIDAVMSATGRARSTVVGYLAEFIEDFAPQRVDGWVPPETRKTVLDAASRVGADRLKPIFDHLNGQVPYDEIRLTMAIERAHESGPMMKDSGRG